ncbi:hypothetical protein C6V83_06785 [Gordonia iterans]|uniref:Uncharacterized protein n=1 Tax=Gordonia iterans TaxID=1004901 RepID=A0A2S0KEB5_9ACTN|nr:hypothetical protein [Gordonia iterans]AVM00019.1 hypothetical protein C6V83_06785 [Gordonia iterans]
MQTGRTARGERWTVRRRLLAWRPVWGTTGLTGSVHWIDQRMPDPVPEPESELKPDQTDDEGGAGWLDTMLNLPDYIAAAFLLPIALTAAYLLSGLSALLATPAVLAARAAGLVPWCIDVRIGDVLVDKRFASGGSSTRQVIAEAAAELHDGRFRTRLESAQPVTSGFDPEIGPDDLAG